MNQYFPKSYSHFGGNVTVELHFFTYARKPDVKNQQVLSYHHLPKRLI